LTWFDVCQNGKFCEKKHFQNCIATFLDLRGDQGCGQQAEGGYLPHHAINGIKRNSEKCQELLLRDLLASEGEGLSTTSVISNRDHAGSGPGRQHAFGQFALGNCAPEVLHW
jgi:hypothetical protein